MNHVIGTPYSLDLSYKTSFNRLWTWMLLTSRRRIVEVLQCSKKPSEVCLHYSSKIYYLCVEILTVFVITNGKWWSQIPLGCICMVIDHTYAFAIFKWQGPNFANPSSSAPDDIRGSPPPLGFTKFGPRSFYLCPRVGQIKVLFKHLYKQIYDIIDFIWIMYNRLNILSLLYLCTLLEVLT